jgi:O-antigen/teichoic acid export membrane protein
MLGPSLMWALKEQADVLVIGKFTGQETVGLYSMAKDLAILPTSKISPL